MHFCFGQFFMFSLTETISKEPIGSLPKAIIKPVFEKHASVTLGIYGVGTLTCD